MIIPVGCEPVAELDTQFRRLARTNPKDVAYVAAICAAAPVRSNWALTAANTIIDIVQKNERREEVILGLSQQRLENYLYKYRKLLRLVGPDNQLHSVSADILFPGVELGDADALTGNLSLVLEALSYRARNRGRCFAYLTAEWTVRSISDFPKASHPDDETAIFLAQNALSNFEGARLFILRDKNLRDAFEFAENAATPITKAELAIFTKYSVEAKQLEALWQRLRDLGANLAKRGRPRGVQNRH